MITRSLRLQIVCGEKTCYSFTERKFCEYVSTQKFGTKWVCALFPSEKGSFTDLVESSTTPTESVLLRCGACLKSDQNDIA
jgi:hypothetical protein